MRTTVRTATAGLAVLALLFATTPAALATTPTEGRLEGLVIGVDGRPAAGSIIHLIDQNGDSLARAETDADGVYSFAELPAGQYAMAIETAQGAVGPVAAPPVTVGTGELARRDVKLMESDAETVSQAGTHYGFGRWFSNLGPAAQAGVVIGFIAVAWGLFELIDDDKEPVTTPIETAG